MIDVTEASDAGATAPPAAPERLLEEVRVLHAVSERLLHLRDAEALAHDVIALLRDVVAHDLGTVLAEATPLEMLAGADIDLAVQHAEPPCPVRGDAAELEQVLLNVAVNACQAKPHGGELTISTVHAVPARGAAVPAAGTVRLQIRDTGTGMDAETAARALEPYFTTRAEGTGLGLSTVARIVDKLGGRIAINSTPRVGTTVSVVLPLAAQPGGSAIETAHGLQQAPT